MQELETEIARIIKQRRQAMGLSQGQLAEGICSQPTISSIEKGNYLPNASMFIELCRRLEISLDHEFLQTSLQFGLQAQFSKHVFNLCKQHQYAEMLEYLDSPAVINGLTNNHDFQVYYYYYGCAYFRVTGDELLTRHYLKMALAYTMAGQVKQPQNEIELLLINSLALISHRLGDDEQASELFKLAITALNSYDFQRENLNVVNYQYGLFLIDQQQYETAAQVLQAGIDWVHQLESYFMLPEYALALVKCYDVLRDDEKRDKYQAYQLIFK